MYKFYAEVPLTPQTVEIETCYQTWLFLLIWCFNLTIKLKNKTEEKTL